MESSPLKRFHSEGIRRGLQLPCLRSPDISLRGMLISIPKLIHLANQDTPSHAAAFGLPGAARRSDLAARTD